MSKTYLYGASGHALVISDILQSKDRDLAAYIDDYKEGETFNETPMIRAKDIPDDAELIISIGDNKIRQKVASSLDLKFAGAAIDKSTIVSESATIEIGTVVMQGAIIQAKARIGKHCIINTGASIDHECQIDDFVHVSPHSTLCGNVHIGEGTWIGAGSTVIQGVKIGKWCIIAAGSVVCKDIPDNSLAAGNRCKVIKQLA